MLCRTLRALCFAAFILLTLPAFPASAWNGFFSYDGLLLGGYIDGKWISDADLQQNEAYHMHRIWGGETVGLYTFRGYKCEGVACALSEDHPDEDEGDASQPSGLASSAGGALRILSVQHMDEDGVKSSSLGCAELAVSGERNALPRAPIPLGKTNGTYVKAVRDHLASRGVDVSQPVITQIYRVDIEGDGADEVLIAASDDLPGSFAEKASLYSSLKDGDSPEDGGYSVLLLRKVERNGVRTVALAESLPGISAVPAVYKICQLADLSGDGHLELIMGEARKGRYAFHVVTLGAEPKSVISNWVVLP